MKLSLILPITFALLFFTFLSTAFPKTIHASTLFTDDFNRPDSTSLGPNWNNLYGTQTAGISNNQAYIKTDGGGYWGFYGINGLNEQDVDVTATFVHQNGDTGIFARFQDINNRVFAGFGTPQQGNNQITFGYVYRGNYHFFWPNTFTGNWGQSYKFELIVSGTTMTLKIDDQIIDTEQMTDTWMGNAGIYANDGYTNVAFDNFIITNETIPTPPPILKVNKTVFIPGFGASWNATAFASCTFDPNPDNWSLAPYAESVYNPILKALTSTEWTVKPFYYDWRNVIPTNSLALNNAVLNSIDSGEKVNLIGHSFGGLVAKDYLDNFDKGIHTNSLLMVGSPLKGVPQSYPAWAGGEIWDDNFITKVAMTLYLKHCGGLNKSGLQSVQTFAPSVRNLLPVFNYLTDWKTKTIKATDNMHSVNQSDWTAQNDFFGIKFETLTGSGFSTLSKIQTKDPGQKDISTGSWLDGKPAGRQYSENGDGTVLLDSSKIDEIHNVTINENHSGLVTSDSGISEILKFIGKPQQTNFTYSEPVQNSALIIIGYPGNFWVADQKGKIIKDRDGMVTITNPKSEQYKLALLPKSSSTLFIVAQFLSSGDIKYKEYKFNGFTPIFKTLNFDSQNPSEEILN